VARLTPLSPVQIPLRYEVIYNSSRSMIRDVVVGRGGALPLFKRGVERDRFDRAIMWLQKDIEQLMMIRTGAAYDKKRSMLANLKEVFACEDCLKMVS
jgi:UV radiation resistance-associated gene protein